MESFAWAIPFDNAEGQASSTQISPSSTFVW
jgi:hypothetical protein